jgi:hypothetical protein
LGFVTETVLQIEPRQGTLQLGYLEQLTGVVSTANKNLFRVSTAAEQAMTCPASVDRVCRLASGRYINYGLSALQRRGPMQCKETGAPEWV